MSTLPKALEPNETPGTLKQDEVSEMWNSLTHKQQDWLVEYLHNGMNGAQATRDSAYQCNTDAAARQRGVTNMHHPKIRQLVQHACRRHIGESELLKRVTDIARASWEHFVSFEDGKAVPDLQKARDRGKMHLVEEVKWDTEYDEEAGETVRYVKSIRLKDDQRAHDQLFKAFGLYDSDGDTTTVEQVTVNQWNQELNAHLQGEADSERWPEVSANGHSNGQLNGDTNGS